IPPRFGLVDNSPDRWKTFRTSIDNLNSNAPPDTQYKVFFLGRHGQGVHNVAEAKYGTKACLYREITWSDKHHWSKLYGDGELTWGPDPKLTREGIQQAETAYYSWRGELAANIPLPRKLYSSPLSRAIHTNQITYEDIIGTGAKTAIIENIREEYGVHTCDQRRTRSQIHEDFPDYLFEEGFTEEDELWSPESRETHADLDRRARKVLDMIFDKDEEQFISITSHGGFIGAFLRICNHYPWSLPTGGWCP
ncbi:hypothetical protein HYDPIDRAFT_77920, partial [Hydnomerulius pinastri MD-312]